MKSKRISFYSATLVLTLAGSLSANSIIMAASSGQEIGTADKSAGNAVADTGDTPLIAAVRQSQTEDVRSLINQGADVNAKNLQNDTPLSVAVHNHDANMVSALLSAGADPNGRGGNKQTPLLTAARDGDLVIVTSLIAAGADVNAKAERYQEHVGSGWKYMSQEATSEPFRPPQLDNLDRTYIWSEGTTALILAVIRSNVDLMRILLEAGADVNATDKHCFSALVLAKSRVDTRENTALINLLHKYGAIEHPTCPPDPEEQERECLSLIGFLPVMRDPRMQEISKSDKIDEPGGTSILVDTIRDLASQGSSDAQHALSVMRDYGYCGVK